MRGGEMERGVGGGERMGGRGMESGESDRRLDDVTTVETEETAITETESFKVNDGMEGGEKSMRRGRAWRLKGDG